MARVPANIYLDLGANWANTLRLQEDLFPNQTGAWLTVAFEASPLIQPFLERYVDYLNGNSVVPETCLPRSGSSAHLQRYAKGIGCPATPMDAMRSCVWKRLDYHLSELATNPQLNSSMLVDSRLQAASLMASTPFTMNTYFSIPAAVSTKTGWTPVGGTRQDLIRGGAMTTTAKTLKHITRSIDFVDWFQHAAKPDDFVFVKMDIEGAEHPVLKRLHTTGAYRLIDALAIEYHGTRTAVDASKELVKQWNITTFAESEYAGMDHVAREATSLPARCQLDNPKPPRTWLTWLTWSVSWPAWLRRSEQPGRKPPGKKA